VTAVTAISGPRIGPSLEHFLTKYSRHLVCGINGRNCLRPQFPLPPRTKVEQTAPTTSTIIPRHSAADHLPPLASSNRSFESNTHSMNRAAAP